VSAQPDKPYLTDTWGPMRAPARWYFSAERVLCWPGDAIHRLYAALDGDGRVRAVGIESGSWGPDDVLDLHRAGPIPEDEAVAHVAAFSGQIGTLAFGLDLRAYVRERPAGPPRLLWVGEGTEATLEPTSTALPAGAQLHIWHSLFHICSPEGDDNRVLADLNAPILRRLLGRFAEQFGPLTETEGRNVTQTGIAP
jgi:hypothetical protein